MAIYGHTKKIVEKELAKYAKHNGEIETVILLGVPEIEGFTDWRKFFEPYAQRVITIDAVDWEGCDAVVDLNKPVEPIFSSEADFVIDHGTIEHVFNAAEAVRGVYKMLKAGGVAIHHHPLNWLNHGYHNFSPCFLREFYEDNGCEVQSYRRQGISCELWNPKPKLTVIPGPSRELLVTVAKKIAGVSDPVYPMQRRYTQGQWKGKQ